MVEVDKKRMDLLQRMICLMADCGGPDNTRTVMETAKQFRNIKLPNNIPAKAREEEEEEEEDCE